MRTLQITMTQVKVHLDIRVNYIVAISNAMNIYMKLKSINIRTQTQYCMTDAM